MNKTSEILEDLNACVEAKNWAAEKSIKTILKKCDRGDWLLWLAKKLDIDPRKLTLAKARTANLVLHLMKDERSINAVNVAEQYGLGNATDEDLGSAVEAYNYVSANASVVYTNYAYASAADAANSSADIKASTYAANAAADAAYAYAYAVYADATHAAINANAARKYIFRKSADICRELLSEEITTAWNKLISH